MDTKPNAVSVSVARGPAADSQYATPRRPTKQETREKILAAALGLFARTGLDRTSVNAIARRADVAHGTVFWHFPSKKQLYAEVARRAGDTFLEHMRVYAASGSMPLRQVIAEWFDSLRHDADIPTLLLSLSGPRRHPDTDDMTEALTARYVEFWTECLSGLENRHARCLIRGKTQLAHVLVATLAGLLTTTCGDTGGDASASLADLAEMIDCFAFGYAANQVDRVWSAS